MATATTVDMDSSMQIDTGDLSIVKQLELSPPPDPLPSGWIIRKSGRNGAYYYYHMDTGISQWEAPTAVSQAPVPVSESKYATDVALDAIGILQKKKIEPIVEEIPVVPDTATIDARAAIDDAAKKRPLEDPLKKPLSSAKDVSSSKRQKKSSSPKQVRVLHILKKHKDSRRPSSWRQKTITSTVDEAKLELQDLLNVLNESKGNEEELRATFSEIARTESDCSSAKRGGDLGFFGRRKMQPAFEESSFGLNVGELSGIVETSSGVHAILRIG